MIRFRGVPVRDVHGLPYTVHQIGDEQWQIVIQNCARYPAGYTFTPVYGNYQEAIGALEHWPSSDSRSERSWAGEDTGLTDEDISPATNDVIDLRDEFLD